MTKYRGTIVLEFETAETLPEISMSGTMAQLQNMEFPDPPRDVDENVALASFILVKVD